jgi:hypothetical protein
MVRPPAQPERRCPFRCSGTKDKPYTAALGGSAGVGVGGCGGSLCEAVQCCVKRWDESWGDWVVEQWDGMLGGAW